MTKENSFLIKPEGSATNFLVLFYKGDSTNNILASYFNGTDWHGNDSISHLSDIDPETNKAPCAVTYNNKLYVFYKGQNSNNIYSSWYDGMKWQGNQSIYEQSGSIKVQSDKSPCAVVARGKIYLFYKAPDSNDIYAASFDGTKWHGNTKISDQPGEADPSTDLTPNAVVFNNYLFLIYKKPGATDLMYTLNDGVNWSKCDAVSIGDTVLQTSDTPHAAVYDSALKLIYKDSQSKSIYISSFDGSHWSGNTEIKDYIDEETVQPLSEYGPSAISYNEKLYIFYESDKDVCEAWYDGTNWNGAKSIKDLSDKAISPKTNRTPGCVIY